MFTVCDLQEVNKVTLSKEVNLLPLLAKRKKLERPTIPS